MEHHDDKKMWNAEQKHLEREKRMEAMKNGEEKKPLKIGGRKNKFILTTISVVLVLAIVSWAAFALGFVQKFVPYGTTNGHKITIPEYNFAYNSNYTKIMNRLSRFSGLLPKKPNGQVDLDHLYPSKVANRDMTWGEFIRFTAEQELIRVKEYSNLALAENINLSDDEKKNLESGIENAVKQMGGELALENALVQIIGQGADIKTYKSILEQNILADKYIRKMVEAYTFSPEEMNKTYDENKDEVDTVKFREFTLSHGLEAPKPDKDKKVDETAKKKYEEGLKKFETRVMQFKNGVKDEASFKQMIFDLSPADKKSEVIKDDSSLRPYLQKGNIGGEVADWLFAKDRKKNDFHIFDANDGNKRAVLFLERRKPVEKLHKIGFIVFNDLNAKATDKNKEVVAKALADYEAKLKELGEIKDEQGLNSAVKKLKDQGYNVTGHWSDTTNITTLPEDFVDFVKKNPSVGSKYIKKNSSTVMMYVNGGETDKAVWESSVRNILSRKKLTAALEALETDSKYQIKENFLGKRLVKLINVGHKTAEEVKAAQAKKDEAKKGEPKKDEPKKDEPKKDEPKKDEPKKEESKKDEAKK